MPDDNGVAETMDNGVDVDVLEPVEVPELSPKDEVSLLRARVDVLAKEHKDLNGQVQALALALAGVLTQQMQPQLQQTLAAQLLGGNTQPS